MRDGQILNDLKLVRKHSVFTTLRKILKIMLLIDSQQKFTVLSRSRLNDNIKLGAIVLNLIDTRQNLSGITCKKKKKWAVVQCSGFKGV